MAAASGSEAGVELPVLQGRRRRRRRRRRRPTARGARLSDTFFPDLEPEPADAPRAKPRRAGLHRPDRRRRARQPGSGLARGGAVRPARPDARDDRAVPDASISDYLGVQTNNVAEYTGVVRALDLARELGAREVAPAARFEAHRRAAGRSLAGQGREAHPAVVRGARHPRRLRALVGDARAACPELGRRRAGERGDRPGPGGRSGLGRAATGG